MYVLFVYAVKFELQFVLVFGFAFCNQASAARVLIKLSEKPTIIASVVVVTEVRLYM